MWRSVSITAFIAGWLLASHCAIADPATTVHTTFYSINGSTAAELNSQMKSRGPHGNWAYTRWYVRWSGSCQVTLEISHTYPRWTNEREAPGSLQRSWNHMMSRLQLHENGHAQHGKNAATEVERSGCRGNVMSIIQKWAAQDEVYDKQTNHGRTQGVALP